MKFTGLIIFLGLSVFLLTSFTEHSKRIEKKISKEITAYFNTEDFSTDVVLVSEENNNALKSDFSKDNLLKVSSGDNLLGYVYVGNAPSKTATFDYFVMFDTNFVIVKSKVLIYREEYGGEIGSRRWLKQFIGKSKNDTISFPNSVDAISGATISVRSMTTAIGNLLKSIKALQLNKAI